MTETELIRKLQVPKGKIDVLLDTDAYNEIDDQFAIAYMLRSGEKLRVAGICAAPFFNDKSSSPADGMERSYQEVLKLLKLAGREELSDLVWRGSCTYLQDENTPVESEAAHKIVELAMAHSEEEPLYIVAIGAITNVASALLLTPEIKDRIVIVWLGGHGLYCPDTAEFNMTQDIAAARVVFGSGAPLVQLPCGAVVEQFSVSEPELKHWLMGKNELCDYLARNTIEAAESYAAGKVWSRAIWDVTAVAWLLNDGERFMDSYLIPAPIPQYDDHYSIDPTRHSMRYVWHIKRDALMQELFDKLSE